MFSFTVDYLSLVDIQIEALMVPPLPELHLSSTHLYTHSRAHTHTDLISNLRGIRESEVAAVQETQWTQEYL